MADKVEALSCPDLTVLDQSVVQFHSEPIKRTYSRTRYGKSFPPTRVWFLTLLLVDIIGYHQAPNKQPSRVIQFGKKKKKLWKYSKTQNNSTESKETRVTYRCIQESSSSFHLESSSYLNPHRYCSASESSEFTKNRH